MQLPADRKNAYNYEELLSCAKGTLFKPESGRLPLPDMLMTDRINLISDTGGKYDKGVIKAELDIKTVRWIDEVLDIVLTRQPIPWEKEDETEKSTSKKSSSKKSSAEAH